MASGFTPWTPTSVQLTPKVEEEPSEETSESLEMATVESAKAEAVSQLLDPSQVRIREVAEKNIWFLLLDSIMITSLIHPPIDATVMSWGPFRSIAESSGRALKCLESKRLPLLLQWQLSNL